MRKVCSQCHRSFDVKDGEKIPLHHYDVDGMEDSEKVVCEGSLKDGIEVVQSAFVLAGRF